ncbi:hypothetical protein BD770DRAFT_476716, partial [Pilaira anomala]
MRAAFESIEENNPFSDARENLRRMRKDINEALTVNDEETVTVTTKVLQDWQKIKKILVPKKDKNLSVVNNNNYGNMLIAQPNNTRIVIHNNTDPATNSISVFPKKKHNMEDPEDVDSSGNGTWEMAIMVKPTLETWKDNTHTGNYPPDHQKVILRSLNSKQHLKPIDPEVMIACQQMHSILINDEMTLDEAEEAIDRIKGNKPEYMCQN